MNTKTITDTAERKVAKRAARKKADETKPKAKRAQGVARGENKKKINRLTKPTARKR